MAIDYKAVENKLRASKAELLSAIAEGGSKAKAGYETAKAEMAAQRKTAVATALEGASGPSGQLVRESLARSGKAYEQAQQGLRMSEKMAADRFSGIAQSQGGYLENSANLVPKYAEQAFYKAVASRSGGRSGGRGGGGGSSSASSSSTDWYKASQLPTLFPGLSKTEAMSGLKEYVDNQVAASGSGKDYPTAYAKRLYLTEQLGVPSNIASGLYKYKNPTFEKYARNIANAAGNNQKIANLNQDITRGKDTNKIQKRRIYNQFLSEIYNKQPAPRPKKGNRGKK